MTAQLPAEREATSRQLAIWFARHPAETNALKAAGLLDVASVLWEAAWREAGWDVTRRNTQLGLYLSEVVSRLQEIALRLDAHDIDADIDERFSVYWKTTGNEP